MNTYPRKCTVCNMRLKSRDNYMLVDSLWRIVTSNQERNNHLCISCVEFRLHRLLTLDDLTDAPVNFSIRRLLQRRIKEVKQELI